MPDEQLMRDQPSEYKECQSRSHQKWLTTHINLESYLEQMLDLSDEMITQDKEFETELRNNFQNIRQQLHTIRRDMLKIP
jgi:hypothetical protein